MAEAVQKLLEIHYFPLGPSDEWDMFRKTIIWCYDVSDIMEANNTGLHKIFNSFVTPRRRTPNHSRRAKITSKNLTMLQKEKQEKILKYICPRRRLAVET